MNKLYKKVGLTAVPGIAFEEVKELYLLIIEDRHCDDEYTVYIFSELALNAANEKVKEWEDWKSYEFEDEQVNDPDWLFCKTAGDYAVTVRRVKTTE